MITHEIIQQMERELKSNLEQLMLAKHETRNERIVALFHSYTRKIVESVAEEIIYVGNKVVDNASHDCYQHECHFIEGRDVADNCIAEQRLKVKEIISKLEK